MKLLPQKGVRLILNSLSFLIKKGIIKEDQAFTFFQNLPIADSTIRNMFSKNYIPEIAPAKRAARNTKYYKTINYR